MLLLCLCVDGGDVAQAAFKAAHLEENALLWARRELAPCSALQLLGQAEACRASVASRHVEAIVLMGSVGMRVSWDVDTTNRLLHPVGVSEMEAALKAALVF